MLMRMTESFVLNICNKAAGLGAAKLKVLNRCFADIGLHKKEFELKKNKHNNSSSYVKLTFLGTEALNFLADYKGGLAINYILDTCFPEAEHTEFVYSLRGGGTVSALERETFNKILIEAMKNLQIIQYGADYI